MLLAIRIPFTIHWVFRSFCEYVCGDGDGVIAAF